MDTISVLCDDPTAVADPYAELKNILLQSCGLSIVQKTTCLLDHPGLRDDKPAVFIDQLISLKLDSLDKVKQVLFSQKMPGYIRDLVNLKDYKNLFDLMQQCPPLPPCNKQSHYLAHGGSAGIGPPQELV